MLAARPASKVAAAGGQMMELMHEIALSFDCWKNGKLPEMQASSRARQYQE
ncbi:hypothetical protein NWF32_13125 [Pseudomonas qingdaonensis]|nr:hypothetical protein [Pseudomonas qingdaonensis]